MNSNRFGTMDLGNLILATFVTGVSALAWGTSGALAAGTGALLACINLYVIRRLAGRAIRQAAAGDTGRASWLMAALGAKMLILFALVWVAIRVYNLALVPFVIGISVLPISLVFAGLWIGSTAGEHGST